VSQRLTVVIIRSNSHDRPNSSDDEAGVAASDANDVGFGAVGAGWGRYGCGDNSYDRFGGGSRGDAVENANAGWGRRGDARENDVADNAIEHGQVNENPSNNTSQVGDGNTTDGWGRRDDVVENTNDGWGRRDDVVENTNDGWGRRDDVVENANDGWDRRDDVVENANDGWGRRGDAVENANDGWGRRGDAGENDVADNAIEHDQVDAGENVSQDAAADSSDAELFSDNEHVTSQVGGGDAIGGQGRHDNVGESGSASNELARENASVALIDGVDENPRNNSGRCDEVQETDEESNVNDAPQAGDGNDNDGLGRCDEVEENTAASSELDVFISQNNGDGDEDSSDGGVFSDIDCNEDASATSVANDNTTFNDDKADESAATSNELDVPPNGDNDN
jgi:hypothetical protein